MTNGGTVLAQGRMYQLLRQAGGVREGTVAITVLASGARAHVFTFG